MVNQLMLNDDGTIKSLAMNGVNVSFRQDQYTGFKVYCKSSENIAEAVLERNQDNRNQFRGKLGKLGIELTYNIEDGHIKVEIVIENFDNIIFKPNQLGVKLGIDTYMEKFPEWNDIFFPTLLRCEKTHLWGYFMTPNGKILVIGSEEPIACWSLDYNELDYNNRENEYIKGGHRIYTGNLDLVNRGPLPQRHPLVDEIQPGEKMKWTIHMDVIEDLEIIKSKLSQLCKAPMIELMRYTLDPSECLTGSIYSEDELDKVWVIDPKGEEKQIILVKEKTKYAIQYSEYKDYGLYTLKALSRNGKCSEASFYIRKPWSWYLEQGRKEVVDKPPAYSHHIESFNSFFTIFLARKHMPDQTLDAVCEQHFERMFDLLYDHENNCVLKGHHRIQDTAGLAAAMANRYSVTRNRKDLEKAMHLADDLMRKQGKDGAYYSNKTHYTSVTYLAKYMLELAFIEYKVGKENELFTKAANRHFDSAVRAIRNLVQLKDNIETEGEMTFEDGMISCSLNQIALYALITESKEEREKCISVAEELYESHRCLSQVSIPDARMNGGTLRFWEAQYNVNIFSNLMNSPCGWTAWKIYGTWYLYLLTNKVHYLQETMNAIGACMQLVDCNTGQLRWAFVGDPYIETQRYVRLDKQAARGRIIDDIIGEQYIDMISGWHREEQFPRYDKFGIDHLVHEIFKALEEVALNNAYIWEDEAGVLHTYNCKIEVMPTGVVVKPYESIVFRVHVNFKDEKVVCVQFKEGVAVKQVKAKGFIYKDLELEQYYQTYK